MLLFSIFGIVLCNVIETAEEQKTVNIHCEPTVIDAVCHVAEPFRLNPNDRLSFEQLSVSQAYNIRVFSVSYDARMQFVPHGFFQIFPFLEQLKLQGVGLKALHHNDFENAWNLCNLTLSDNKLGHIPSSIFSRAQNLIELNLDGNEILHLDNDAFNGLYQLYFLSLSRNRLITLKSFAFSGAPHLTDLRLEYNEIEVLEPGVFDLPDLMFLYLGHNQLKTILDYCFKNTQLNGLDLQSNDLTHLGNSIYNLKTLRKLILSDNDNISDLNTTRITEMNLVEFNYRGKKQASA